MASQEHVRWVMSLCLSCLGSRIIETVGDASLSCLAHTTYQQGSWYSGSYNLSTPSSAVVPELYAYWFHCKCARWSWACQAPCSHCAEIYEGFYALIRHHPIEQNIFNIQYACLYIHKVYFGLNQHFKKILNNRGCVILLVSSQIAFLLIYPQIVSV